MLDTNSRRCKNFAFLLIASIGMVATYGGCEAHEDTQPLTEPVNLAEKQPAKIESEPIDAAKGTCQVTIDLVDDFSGDSLPGIVRVSNLDTGRAIQLEEGFHRAESWYSLPPSTSLRLPTAHVRIEALQGLETLLAEQVVDLTAGQPQTVKIPLSRFYDSRFRDWYAGNTHLHLMKMSREEAERYLQVVPATDGLDLVFLSHLRRIPAERDYISNEIVEESFAGGDVFERLSADATHLAPGEELRHNFGEGGEGYGHAMLLGLQEMIHPVSLGPGIMQEGTDGTPLQPGIRQACEQGGTVIWCHNAFGYEDIPNWTEGIVHAQNIFDGGSTKRYEDTCYRYLNIGLKVPFSTGTDWFICDFARVYAPVYGNLTADSWLGALRSSKSYITNGPLLELETELAGIGETLDLDEPGHVSVQGRAMGRLDFRALELVFNGEVVHQVPCVSADGYFQAELRHVLAVDQPGWFALRIPAGIGRNELGHPLFAHTSPIYVRVDGQDVFQIDAAKGLIDEMKTGIETINDKALFGDETERQRVSAVYERGVKQLEEQIAAHSAIQ